MFTQLALEFNRNPQLDDDEGFQQVPTAKCPFDSSHIMQPKNLITHINRCKSPNKHLYVQCRYDPCHWLYMEQLQHHYQQCPTRKQYYADLDLKDGDWDQQQFMLKLQQKAFTQKIEKRKRKILKLMMIFKLRKKLKRASTKQQFESIKSALLKEQSCFIRKSNKIVNNQFEIFTVKPNAKYQSKSFENQSHVHEKTHNISQIRPPMNSSFYQGQTINNYNFVYGHEAPILQQNHIQYPQPYYPPFLHPIHQPQYFPFPQQQTFYPQQQLSHHTFMQPNIIQHQQFYCNSDTSYPPRMIKKPRPEKGLMFSQTANTQDFIKKTHKNKNTNQVSKNQKDHPKNSQHTIANYQYGEKKRYPNMINFYDQNQIYQKHSHQQYQSYTPFSKNFVNYPTNFPQRKSKNENCNNINKIIKQKKIPHINDSHSQNELDIPQPKKILNFEITSYDFIPFDLNQDLTIKKQLSYQTDDVQEKSNFLEMKEMLQILQDSSKG